MSNSLFNKILILHGTEKNPRPPKKEVRANVN